MKAVVLEIRGGYAAVLREDGTVERIRRECRVGETVELEDEKKPVRLAGRPIRWAAAAAAALVLLSAGGTYGYNNAYAYSYVSLDVNPSIEYVLNRKNQLLSVQALNDSAADIVDGLSSSGLRGGELSDVLGETLELLYEEDYLGEDRENCLLINVSSRGDAQEEVLTELVESYFDGRDELAAYVTKASVADERQAKALGLSAGRYVLMGEILSREDDAPAPGGGDALPFAQATVGELLTRGGHRPTEAVRPADAPALPAGDGASAEPAEGARTDAPPAAPDGAAPAPDGGAPRDGTQAPEGEGFGGPEVPAADFSASGEPSK